MKGSSATSARPTAARRTGRSSARRTLTPIRAESFALSGPSDPPEPAFNAYRKDLADAALAGRVIASHYAEPVDRLIVAPTALRAAPDAQAELIRELAPGERFALLDDTLGWGWGYAGADRRVGYVRSEAVGPG